MSIVLPLFLNFLPFAQKDSLGCTVDYVAGRNRYVGYLISLGMFSFKGMRIGLDCANGASWMIAKSVFAALGVYALLLSGFMIFSMNNAPEKENNRTIKQGDGMYLLENIANTAVLIECGFLTNEAECKKLSEKEYQKELSFSIVCGIIEYIEQNGK